MKRQWFVMAVGYDCGGPESGPIWRSSEEYFKASTEKKAQARAARIFEKYGDGTEGYTVRKATEADMPKIVESLKFMAILTLSAYLLTKPKLPAGSRIKDGYLIPDDGKPYERRKEYAEYQYLRH